MASPLLDWLRAQTAGWSPSIVGVFREHAEHEWPITAESGPDLRRVLTEAGHLLPLPTEPAALTNVMEIELRTHLLRACEDNGGIRVTEGTERSYPDLEVEGEAVGGGVRAVDIKCARKKSATSLNNRIALYTGNTYFLWPQLKFSGILRPFSEYAEHLSIVVLYRFDKTLPERIADVEVLVHETWRIASTKRASATREYIGSVQKVEEIVNGTGDFDTPDEFYDFWRHSGRKWKKSPEAERLLRRALEEQSGS